MAGFDLSEQGRQLLLTGNFPEAVASLEGYLALNPEHAGAWHLLGAAHHQMSNLDAAKTAFQNAARLNFHHIQSHFALASVSIELGDPASAILACSEAVSIAPDDPQVWFSLAVAQEAAGRFELALGSYDRALALRPVHIDALKNRGVLLLSIGRVDDAVANNRLLTSTQPYSFDAQFRLGTALIAQKSHKAAAQVFLRATNLSPNNPKGLLHTGFALAQCESFVEAQQLLDRANAIDPEMVKSYRHSIFRHDSGSSLDARTLFLLRHYDAIERCDWGERAYFLKRFTDLIADARALPITDCALGFRAMTMGLNPEAQLALARQIASGIKSGIATLQFSQTDERSEKKGKKIRLGYVSPDFRNHPTGLMTENLFAWHDRSKFEVYGYALGGDDQSELRKKIEVECDRFIDLGALSDEKGAQRIAHDAIDILIDLAGYTDRARPTIFALRAAPIQISWLGYVATMGSDWIDYLVADSLSVPSHDSAFYSEKILAMPSGQYLCSYANAIVAPAPERHLVGLPEGGIVLGAMHNSYKIDPEIFEVWMRRMRSDSSSTLWLLDTSPEAKANLIAAASGYGVDSERLIFAPKVPHADHLVRLQLVDLVLDTPQCNGSTTIADALVAGVPVVTCVGKTFAQRMAASLLHAADQDALITGSVVEYEKLVSELMSSPVRLAEARDRIERARSVALFFRPEQWLRYYESALESVWWRFCDGLPPESMEIKT